MLYFFLGVACTVIAWAVYRWFLRGIRRRILRRRKAATLAARDINTISQVLHLAVQGSPTGVTVVDRNGDVVLSNARAHDMGIVRERTLNPDVWAEALKVYEDHESRTLPMEIPRRKGASQVTAVQAVIQPLTRVDSRFVVVYATDESENVRMESARRDFVANVSHELKTPVGGMALLAEALIESKDDPDTVEHFSQRLVREAHRLADMITELISLSKLQGAEALPNMQQVLVDEVIDEAIARNQLAAENAEITVSRDAPGGLLVLGDKNLLVTAVANLLSNAINYSPRSTPVTVSQELVDEDTVWIRVADRGIGISPGHQHRVFERFFRVDKARSRSTGGTGLGLAIVKHVAANHGGEISLWSRPGKGSTFTLELPLYKPEKRTILTDDLSDDLTLPEPG